MAGKLLAEQHDVIVWNRSPQRVEKLKSSYFVPLKGGASQNKQNFKIARTIKELVESLEKPRVIWLMVPAGEATEEVLKEVNKFVQENDIVVDGGNAYYKDTERRYQKFRAKGIRFLGIGVSGGIIAAKVGYPLMAGGDRSAYEQVRPVLDSLAKPRGGHEYFGAGGAGHFVKMVHNGIEYGIMQSLGEGFDVLKNAPYKLDLLKIAKLYQKGTLVSGFMLDRMVDALTSGIVDKITGEIDATGEVQWMVEQAKEEGIPVEIIEASLNYRQRSKKDKKIQKSYTAKMVASLRNAFGAHPVRQAQGKGVKDSQRMLYWKID